MEDQLKERVKMFSEREIKVLATSVIKRLILRVTRIIVRKRVVVNFRHIRRKREPDNAF